VFKKVEVSCTNCTNDEERQNRISEILAAGVYAYLKKNGHLRGNLGRKEKIKRLLVTAKGISNQVQEEIERELP